MTAFESSELDRSIAAAVPETQDPEPAPLGPAGANPARRLPRRSWLAAIAGVIILPVVVAAGLTWSAANSGTTSSDAAAARLVSAADMEREYGVKVTLVAVTAAGGLVDLRFTILDKAKAARLFHDDAAMPELYVEATGAVISHQMAMAHKVTLLDGATYFLLYPNSGGMIQAGTQVSVVIDAIRLAPITAQS
jgi:hypothetical protein